MTGGGEVISVHVGQCGNQIGRCFWDLALKEHAAYAAEEAAAEARDAHARARFNSGSRSSSSSGSASHSLKKTRSKRFCFDGPLNAYFRNVDTRHSPPAEIPLGDGTTPVYALRARAILVDTEQGVIGETLKGCGPLGELFDDQQLLYGVSGAGNNFAHGFAEYGSSYRDELGDRFRKQAEHCDGMLGFFVTHSLGGGTGSGLGTYILSMLEDVYPKVLRFSSPVIPTPEDDDVITSPYNAVLAMHQLIEHADMIFPAENQALLGICAKVAKYEAFSSGPRAAGSVTSRLAKQPGAMSGAEKPFDKMNNIVAHMLANLTAGCRFPGNLNCDLSDLKTNLVPFQGLHYITSSLSPLSSLSDVGRRESLVRTDQMFRAAFSRDNQIVKCHGGTSKRYLACALLARGNVRIGDVDAAIDKAKGKILGPHWSDNQVGWKAAVCSASPVGSENAVLRLANSTGAHASLTKMECAFRRLYKRKAHVHHFTQYIEQSQMDDAINRVCEIRDDYLELEGAQPDTRKLTGYIRSGFPQNPKKLKAVYF